jgi:hypothetical protein
LEPSSTKTALTPWASFPGRPSSNFFDLWKRWYFLNTFLKICWEIHGFKKIINFCKNFKNFFFHFWVHFQKNLDKHNKIFIQIYFLICPILSTTHVKYLRQIPVSNTHIKYPYQIPISNTHIKHQCQIPNAFFKNINLLGKITFFQKPTEI